MMQVEKIRFTTHTRNNASHKYTKELGTKICLVMQVEGVEKIIVDSTKYFAERKNASH